jgi:HD-GYP domain-containing protein (c-di-GMP phosphodiesterase class II)
MVGLDDEILLKSGRLTNQEYDLVKHHPMIGAALTAPIRLPIPIAPLILHHHERFDGFGYPIGLKATDIPLGARILAVGEVFDAMLTSRHYRQALTFSDAVARLQAHAGRQLDPKIVELFIQKVTLESWQAIARKATY